MGDFDGDHVPDCAKPGPQATDLSFFQGLGGGAFATTAVVTGGILPSGYTLLLDPLDLSADGRADIVLQTLENTGYRDFYVLQGQSDGTFTRAASTLAYPCGCGQVATSTPVLVGVPGDFDGNGKLDVLIPWQKPGGVGLSTTPELYWGVLYMDDTDFPRVASTDAGFTLGSTGKIGPQFTASGPIGAAGDANGDHKLDAFVILHTQTLGTTPSSQFVAFAVGNGDRTFQPGTATTKDEIAGTDGATSVVSGDYNQDGKLDLLVGLPAGQTVFYGDGAGAFSTTAP